MTSRTDIKKEVNRGLAWVGLASSTVGLLDLLAHILIPLLFLSEVEYGTAAIVMTLFPVLDLATDMGLSAAIIQRDDHTPERLSTVFWLNVMMSGLIAVALAIGVGPFLAWLHDNPLVGLMLAAYGGKLLWQNVYFVPTALMRREMRFDELSIIRMIANVAEFAGKVGSAALGAGPWCFVIGPICRVLVTGIGVQLRCPWRPKLVLRLRETWEWAVFGIKTSASEILYHLYSNLDYQVVAYYFGEAANGVYTLMYRIVLEPVLVLSEVVVQIAFPTFSRLRHAKDKLIAQFIEFTRLNLIVLMLVLGIVFVVGAELVEVIWAGAYMTGVDALPILCFVGVLRALAFVVPPLLNGIGRPTLTLKYMGTAAVVVPISFVVGAELLGDRLGFVSVALAWAIGYPIAFAVLLYLAFAQLDMRASLYLRRIAGILACAVVAIAAGELLHWVLRDSTAMVRLLAGASTIAVLFGLLLALFQGITPRAIGRAIKGDATPPSRA